MLLLMCSKYLRPGTCLSTVESARSLPWRWASGSPTLSICDSDGNCVGLVWINVRDGDARTGWVGYWLLPRARRLGLATRAVRLIARWATGDLGITRLRLTTEPANERSRLVARRSGFREVAVLRASARIGDRVIDQVIHEYEAEAD